MRYYKIFFSILVLMILVVPLLHMNTAEITEQENRTLTKFPKLKDKKKININYGKEFESWLGDHFGGRDQLINSRFQAIYKINSRIENDKAFIGDDGWMFEKWNTVYRPSIEKQKEKIEKNVEILKKFADKFKDKNIPIYLVLTPERDILYQKYWERYYKPKPKLDYAEEITKLLSDYQNIKILPIQEEINNLAKDEFIFYKDDPHLLDLPRKMIIKKLFRYLREDYFLENKKIFLEEKRGIERKQHVANISAKLGLDGKVVADESRISLSLNLKSTKIEDKKYVVQKNNGYKGITLTPYMVSKNEDAPILKEGIFLGPCYTETAYKVLSPLFSISKKIYLNVSEAGTDAVEYMKEKMKSLDALKENSAVVIMIIPEDYFQTIEAMSK